MTSYRGYDVSCRWSGTTIPVLMVNERLLRAKEGRKGFRNAPGLKVCSFLPLAPSKNDKVPLS